MTPPNRAQRRRPSQQLAAQARDGQAMPPIARVQQLSYAAQLSAVRSDCDCEACGWLREASDLMLELTRSTEVQGATGLNPPA
jgi:hypothetical protein